MRIGIVNASPAATEALRGVLRRAAGHRVIWTAATDHEAVAACARDLPDVVLMELTAPRIDGVAATREIMARTPCPILIVAGNAKISAGRMFEAMGAGAFDAIDAPTIGSDEAAGAAPLLAKLAAIADLAHLHPDHPISHRGGGRPFRSALVVVGASAGGPTALTVVLKGLPTDFSGALIIVQHVDERFTPAMAVWLNQQSAIPVRLAVEGDEPAPGTALLAGSSDHLVFKSARRLGYTPEPRDLAYRPSVDVLFRSVAGHWQGEAIGVLLTGMGSDGAAGLKELRGKGYPTIAQDKTSSAVYGMPKAAAAIDAATEILPLGEIASRLAELATLQPKARGVR